VLVSHRPLVFVSGLTICDYLLWNWSLSGNHVVLALISGLSLLPLAVVCLVSLVFAFARLIAWFARRPAVERTGRRGQERIVASPRPTAPGGPALGEPPTSTTPAGRSSSKLAA
jgi:hypothetical protein